MELAKRFIEEKSHYYCDNWLFYVWGHSYEFDNNDNWNVIEEFSELCGGREDIWYATNIEIYNYVTAYDSLEYSLDMKLVRNPSAIDVWIRHKNEAVVIPSGKTVALK